MTKIDYLPGEAMCVAEWHPVQAHGRWLTFKRLDGEQWSFPRAHLARAECLSNGSLDLTFTSHTLKIKGEPSQARKAFELLSFVLGQDQRHLVFIECADKPASDAEAEPGTIKVATIELHRTQEEYRV